MKLPRATLAALALLLAAPAPAEDPAAPAPLPPRSRVLLLLRSVVYDRNLPARTGPEAVVVVLYRPGETRSEEDRDAMLDAIETARREVVAAGRPVRGRALPWTGEEELLRHLAGERVAVLYACAGLEGAAPAIARATRTARVLSASGARAMAVDGLALALVVRGSRAGIVVNLEAARAEGADLDAALLGVADVIGRPVVRR